MSKTEIILSDVHIEHLINGGSIDYKLPDKSYVSIRQSYVRDAVAPVINRPNKVVNTHNNAVVNKHYFNSLVNDSIQRGVD